MPSLEEAYTKMVVDARQDLDRRIDAIEAAVESQKVDLIVLGSYLIVRALRNIHRYDRLIHQLKMCHSKLSDFLD